MNQSVQRFADVFATSMTLSSYKRMGYARAVYEGPGITWKQYCFLDRQLSDYQESCQDFPDDGKLLFDPGTMMWAKIDGDFIICRMDHCVSLTRRIPIEGVRFLESDEIEASIEKWYRHEARLDTTQRTDRREKLGKSL